MQVTQHIGRVAELRRRRTENDSCEGVLHSLKVMNIFRRDSIQATALSWRSRDRIEVTNEQAIALATSSVMTDRICRKARMW